MLLFILWKKCKEKIHSLLWPQEGANKYFQNCLQSKHFSLWDQKVVCSHFFWKPSSKWMLRVETCWDKMTSRDFTINFPPLLRAARCCCTVIWRKNSLILFRIWSYQVCERWQITIILPLLLHAARCCCCTVIWSTSSLIFFSKAYFHNSVL